MREYGLLRQCSEQDRHQKTPISAASDYPVHYSISNAASVAACQQHKMHIPCLYQRCTELAGALTPLVHYDGGLCVIGYGVLAARAATAWRLGGCLRLLGAFHSA